LLERAPICCNGGRREAYSKKKFSYVVTIKRLISAREKMASTKPASGKAGSTEAASTKACAAKTASGKAAAHILPAAKGPRTVSHRKIKEAVEKVFRERAHARA
jgi:hypothetical protein